MYFLHYDFNIFEVIWQYITLYTVFSLDFGWNETKCVEFKGMYADLKNIYYGILVLFCSKPLFCFPCRTSFSPTNHHNPPADFLYPRPGI